MKMLKLYFYELYSAETGAEYKGYGIIRSGWQKQLFGSCFYGSTKLRNKPLRNAEFGYIPEMFLYDRHFRKDGMVADSKMWEPETWMTWLS